VAKQLKPKERLQFALLDRLTDDGSDTSDQDEEVRGRRVSVEKRLREKLMRDLAWLFNTTRLERDDEMAHLPYARHSVINFGLPAHAGETASSIEIEDLEQEIRQAILDFEPRILPETLEVKAIADLTDLDRHNVLGIQIRARFWAQPVPLELLLRTEIDLETGKVQVADLASSRVS
jgi:type VI secretion system protein ImpF